MIIIIIIIISNIILSIECQVTTLYMDGQPCCVWAPLNARGTWRRAPTRPRPHGQRTKTPALKRSRAPGPGPWAHRCLRTTLSPDLDMNELEKSKESNHYAVTWNKYKITLNGNWKRNQIKLKKGMDNSGCPWKVKLWRTFNFLYLCNFKPWILYVY